MPSAGGEISYPEAGSRHIHGPEFSADVGLRQHQGVRRTSRARPASPGLGPGGTLQRLVEFDLVDWFPHLSPVGDLAAYKLPDPSVVRPTSRWRSAPSRPTTGLNRFA